MGQIHHQGNINQDYHRSKTTVFAYLKALGVHKIDTLILSHGDYDHAGETVYLMKQIPILSIYMNDGNDSALEQEIKKNMEVYGVKLKKLKESVLIQQHPFSLLREKNKQNENEDSIIVYTKLNNKNILWMGDASIKNENFLINAYNLPIVDILKVGHHGSKTSTSSLLLGQIKPTYALISVGYQNRYGHPANEVMELLNKHQIITLQTKDVGMIRFEFRNEIQVFTAR